MPVIGPVTREKRVIFSRGERAFNVRDVLDAAVVRGELEPLWENFARARACEERANEEELELDEEEIDSAVVAFRYEHDLITAEETERWLDERGLSLEEFSEFFSREYWGRNYTGSVETGDAAYLSTSAEAKELFIVDLILSGALDRLARQLSFRIAALAEANDSRDGVAEQLNRFRKREKIREMSAWLDQLGRDQGWLEEMLAAEAAFERTVESLLNEQTLRRELASLRLNLTRFEIETVEVDSRQAAAEVLACVRNDGMEMEEVAAESRFPYRSEELLLEDIACEEQQRFVSARAGAIFEATARGDAFEVSRIKSRTEPTLQDETIRARLAQRIVDRHFDELISRHIQFPITIG